MSAVDSTGLRVRALVLEAAAAAYHPAEPVRCSCCGVQTDTRDGYPVPTSLGEVWVCIDCNLDPRYWDATDAFFVGAGAHLCAG